MSGVRFVLDVQFPDEIEQERLVSELGRILRYWGGSIKQVGELKPGVGFDVSDSDYAVVGSWRLSENAD